MLWHGNTYKEGEYEAMPRPSYPLMENESEVMPHLQHRLIESDEDLMPHRPLRLINSEYEALSCPSRQLRNENDGIPPSLVPHIPVTKMSYQNQHVGQTPVIMT